MRHLRPIILILAMLLMLGAVSCGVSDEPKSVTYYEYFDTVCYISSYRGSAESDDEFSQICAELESLFERYHRLFDIYHEYEGINNLATVNKCAGESSVDISVELIDFLLYGKEIYHLTHGEVNIAMGSVLSLWHRSRQVGTALPSNNDLILAASHTSIDVIEIDKAAGRVYVNDEKAMIDVGAIAKGYVAERAAELLESRGIGSYVINLGGNIRAVGQKPDGKGWVTGITKPYGGDGEFVCRIVLSDASCVTSGSYQRYFEVDGKKYHHIIDKDTLYPSEHFASVSVIAADSALADALSTALFSMTYDEGLALCDSIGNIQVIWVKDNGEILTTEGISAIFAN